MRNSKLSPYLNLLKKWYWLFFIAAVFGGVVGFGIAMTRTPQYQSQTVLALGGLLDSPEPTYTNFQTSRELAQIYAALAKTDSILQGTIDTLDLPFSVGHLKQNVQPQVQTGTPLLTIRVTDTDPNRAALTANAIAEQLVQASPPTLTPEQQDRMQLAQTQLLIFQNLLTEDRLRLQQITLAIQSTIDPTELERLMLRRDDLVRQITTLSENILQVTDTLNSLEQRTDIVKLVDQAQVPTGTSTPNRWMLAAVGSMAGIFLAVVGVILLEYIDNTIRVPEQASKKLALPVLGAISSFKPTLNGSPLLVCQAPDSPPAEQFRSLSMHLWNADQLNESKVYLLTGAEEDSGSTTIAANLAATLAASNARVVLVDANVRTPGVHRLLQLENEIGLTSLMNGHLASANGHGSAVTSLLSERLMQPEETDIPNLSVITSGPQLENGSAVSKLLYSAQLRDLFDSLRSSEGVDVILIDTPPCTPIGDSVLTAALLRARVILVVRSGQTDTGTILKAKTQFEQFGCTIEGIVLNDVHA